MKRPWTEKALLLAAALEGVADQAEGEGFRVAPLGIRRAAQLTREVAIDVMKEEQWLESVSGHFDATFLGLQKTHEEVRHE